MKHQFTITSIVCLSIVFVTTPAGAQSSFFPVVPGTNRPISRLTFDHANNYQQLSGTNVVWEKYDGNDFEIFMHSGGSTLQLTDNTDLDSRPQISGSRVVWHNRPQSMDSEIMLYENGTTTQLTNDAFSNSDVGISGNFIVWQNSNAGLSLYDGTTIQSLAGPTANDPRVGGNGVVWRASDGNDAEIYHRNLTTGVTTQLSNNNYNDHFQQVSDNRAIWTGYVNPGQSQGELFVYDGSSTQRITNNTEFEIHPVISGDLAAWESGGDIYMYDFNSGLTQQITDSAEFEGLPEISGSNIVWQGFDGNDFEIYLFDGSTIFQLTDNGFEDARPQIDGDAVAWVGDGDIYLAIPEPATLSLMALTGVLIVRRRR